MGEATTQLITEGGIVFFAVFVMVFGAIALHRLWIVVGSYHTETLRQRDKSYDELRKDHDDLKASSAESNRSMREMVTAVTTLTSEVRDMRREMH